jgi:hypothetical protein
MLAYAGSSGYVFEQIIGNRENEKTKNLAGATFCAILCDWPLPEAHSKVAGDAGIWSPIVFSVFLLLVGLLLKL